MRTFYIFNISREFAILTKENPYNLFKTMEEIYYLSPNDIEVAYQTFETLAKPFDKKRINNDLFQKHQNNQQYTKFKSNHVFNNYYTDEQSQLTVNTAHLIIKSTSNIPIFLKDLNPSTNLFVCDFHNKDYFWLEQLNY